MVVRPCRSAGSTWRRFVRYVAPLLIGVALIAASSPVLFSQHQIIRDVIGSGGKPMEGETHRLHGTVSQTSIGRLSRPDENRHNVGFWYWAKETTARIVVRIPETSAEPGTQLTIPLLLEEVGGLPPGLEMQFRARIRFNPSLLKPIGSPSPCEPNAEWCTVEINGTTTTDVGTIAEMPFLAKLGNAESTPMIIDEFTVLNLAEHRPKVIRIDGIFRLLGICREGDSLRLIHSGGPASRVAVLPNPATERTTLEYVSNRPGQVTVTFVDLLGNDVAVVASHQADAGRLYTLPVDLSQIPSGLYFVIFRTPSETRTTQLTVRQ